MTHLAFMDRSWQLADVATELVGNSGAPSVTPTISMSVQRGVLLGRLELIYDETATVVSFPNSQGITVQNLPVIASVGGGSAACFLPDSPGLTEHNYLGVPLLPGQTIRISLSATVATTVSARIACRPLSQEEQKEAERQQFTPGFRFLYGFPSQLVAAGATVDLTMNVERSVEPGYNLGTLVLATENAAPFHTVNVNSISVAGVLIDAETTAASADWRHWSHTNARGRGVVLKSGLTPGQAVRVNVTNSDAVGHNISGVFIRAPGFGTGLSGGNGNDAQPLITSGSGVAAGLSSDPDASAALSTLQSLIRNPNLSLDRIKEVNAISQKLKSGQFTPRMARVKAEMLARATGNDRPPAIGDSRGARARRGGGRR